MFASWPRKIIARIKTTVSAAIFYLKSTVMEQTAPKRYVALRLVLKRRNVLASQKKLVRPLAAVKRAIFVSLRLTTVFLSTYYY